MFKFFLISPIPSYSLIYSFKTLFHLKLLDIGFTLILNHISWYSSFIIFVIRLVSYRKTPIYQIKYTTKTNKVARLTLDKQNDNTNMKIIHIIVYNIILLLSVILFPSFKCMLLSRIHLGLYY